MNPADVAQYLREVARAGAVDAKDAAILEAAANIVLRKVLKALLQPGQKVVLVAAADDGWRRETATVVGKTDLSWDTTVTVRVEEKYRTGLRDDGLRDVDVIQIEEIEL